MFNGILVVISARIHHNVMVCVPDHIIIINTGIYIYKHYDLVYELIHCSLFENTRFVVARCAGFLSAIGFQVLL